jgi:hypothetical protein
MEPYKRFIRESYVKRFNHFLKNVCEPKIFKKYNRAVKLKLYGIGVNPKKSVYEGIPKEELLDSQATVSFFIDSEPSIFRGLNYLEELIWFDGKSFLQLQNGDWMGYDPEKFRLKIHLNNRPLYPLDYVTEDNLNEEVEPSEKAVKNICDSKKFCEAQGKITFGQLREIVTNAKAKRLYQHIGEGGYKAALRLLPWFFPQLAIAGFTGSVLRAFNKIFRPGIEETTGYKTWWGKTVMKIFNLVEGELGTSDPLSKIFFISDGLMTMLDDKLKVKFARYIADVASEKPDDEEVPEYFVENELRKYLNEKFLLDPPLSPKTINESKTLLENTQQRQVISTVVKDIITLFKDNDDGEFYLPEDIDENKMTYEFSKLSTPFSVELILEENENIDNFKINGEYAEDDDTITIVINYNPNKKRTLVYDLIGELNEIVAHEIRHIAQKEKGHFELGGSKEEDPYKYYTQPHELDALNFGFKRMARMTKKPIEILVQNWFDKNKDIHMLNPEQKKDVIKKILNYKK